MHTLWQQLVAQRRQELEDTFKIDLSVKPAEREVKMEEVTPLWEELMLKAWQHYLGLSAWLRGLPRVPLGPEASSPDLLPCSSGWVGLTSLKPHEPLLTENRCCFAS